MEQTITTSNPTSVQTVLIRNKYGHATKVFGCLYPSDTQTRCIHWHGKKDIIALKFACCEKYWPCYECHSASECSANGKVEKYFVNGGDNDRSKNRRTKVVLCGCCGTEMTFNEYLDCEYVCGECKSEFNPGCKLHYGLYFEFEKEHEQSECEGECKI